MKARDYVPGDKMFVQELCAQHNFDLPQFFNVAKVVDGVGAGIIVPRHEVQLILDMRLSRRVRAEAFHEIFAEGMFAGRRYGISEWFAFPAFESFKQVLLKHGFEEIKEQCLRLEF